MSGRVEFVMDHVVLPSGATLDDWDEARTWAVHVQWRGPRSDTGRGGYAVTKFGGQHQMSRAGNWAWNPQPFQQRLYRWETFDEALTAAREHVDASVENRMTWAQILEWRASR